MEDVNGVQQLTMDFAAVYHTSLTVTENAIGLPGRYTGVRRWNGHHDKRSSGTRHMQTLHQHGIDVSEMMALAEMPGRSG